MSLSKIDGNLESVADDLAEIVAKAQKDLLPVIQKALGKLETSGGKIVLSDKNLIITSQIVESVREALESGVYIEGLRAYSMSFTAQSDLIKQYFSKEFAERFADRTVFNTVLQDAKRNALNNLLGSSIDKVFYQPMTDIIQQSITTGASPDAAVKLLTDFIDGNDQIEGVLYRNVKQVARDSFSNFSSSYTKIIADDVGAEWFGYRGGKVRDSRAFCVERDGKIFHRKEIEAWGAGQRTTGMTYPEGGTWQGQARGTDSATIFSWRGGYNCIHYLAALSESVVPESVKERVRAQGYIK